MTTTLVHGEVYSIQHYVIKFVSDLLHVTGFLQVLWFPPPIKPVRHDITEILLKVALNTINLTLNRFKPTFSFTPPNMFNFYPPLFLTTWILQMTCCLVCHAIITTDRGMDIGAGDDGTSTSCLIRHFVDVTFSVKGTEIIMTGS